MLVRNTEELGCGLIMMGGPNSFGAGGWTNTELEKAMPVDFQIKSAKVVPVVRWCSTCTPAKFRRPTTGRK